jgi:hypothetical protein
MQVFTGWRGREQNNSSEIVAWQAEYRQNTGGSGEPFRRVGNSRHAETQSQDRKANSRCPCQLRIVQHAVPFKTASRGQRGNRYEDSIQMPQRYSTRRAYESWLSNHIMPKWGQCSITDVQRRPVELWLQSLELSPKSRVGLRFEV